MNDSISVSSSSFSNTSSNNSKSNSLNRNELTFNSESSSSPLRTDHEEEDLTNHKKKILLFDAMESDANNNIRRLKRNVEASKKKFNSSASSAVANYFLGPRKSSLPVGNRRRARSQILFNGDDLNTINDQNKLLIEDLYYLKKQLKDKDTIINELNDIRDRLESEIHELSASLFEQAYTMVNTAKAETAQAEKLLKEANGKIDVLQAEVTALKEVVTNNNNNNKQNHHLPQGAKSQNGHVRQSSLNLTLNQMSKMSLATAANLTMPSITCSNTSLNKSNSSIVLQVNSESLSVSSEMGDREVKRHVKGHKRGLSHNDIQLQPQPKSFIDKLFNSSTSQKELEQQQKKHIIESFQANRKQQAVSRSSEDVSNNDVAVPEQDYDIEINEVYFREIKDWRQTPDLLETSEFTKRVYREDIRPCLDFSDEAVCNSLLDSIRSNCLFIEDVKVSQLPGEAVVYSQCGLSRIASVCEYKIRLNENEAWISISKHSRNRVISVCDFFTYLRYIKDGLVKCDIIEIYWNIIDLRKKICLSRLGI